MAAPWLGGAGNACRGWSGHGTAGTACGILSRTCPELSKLSVLHVNVGKPRAARPGAFFYPWRDVFAAIPHIPLSHHLTHDITVDSPHRTGILQVTPSPTAAGVQWNARP